MIKLIVLLLVAAFCLALPDQSSSKHEEIDLGSAEPAGRKVCPKKWFNCVGKNGSNLAMLCVARKSTFKGCVPKISDIEINNQCKQKIYGAGKNPANYAFASKTGLTCH